MATDRRPTGLQWLWGMRDWPDYERYLSGGGNLSYQKWTQEGKPRSAFLTPSAKAAMEKPEYKELMAGIEKRQAWAKEGWKPSEIPSRTPPTAPPSEESDGLVQYNIQQALLGLPSLTEEEWIAEMKATKAPRLLTKEQAQKMLDEDYGGEGQGYRIHLDTTTGGWDVVQDPYYQGKETPEEMPGGFFSSYEEAVAASPEGYVPQQQAGGWWGLRRLDPSEMKGYISPGETAANQRQAELINWYREQEGMQLEATKQARMAQMATQPISWLQYEAESGRQPVVQPWMMPLMSQQYQGQVGQQIPGWTAQGGTAMPELTRPSAQLWSRMGPTAQQQYMGYRQARTGASPEEQQFRRQSSAAPSGWYKGLQRTR